MNLVVDGRQAYVYTGGKPFDTTLPCVVFIHGALHDHSVWTLLARWYAHRGWSVLALDQPGHGRSEGPPLADVEALAAWTLALLDAAGVARTHGAALVGHSMGSLVALEAAGRAPQRITRLVMVGTAYPMKVSEALLALAREAPLKAIDRVNAFSISSLATKPGYPGPGMWLHGSNRALMRRMLQGQPGLNLFEHDFRVCDRYAGGLQAAAALRCPVHFVLGDEDQMTSPGATREIIAALKVQVDVQVHRLPCGHSLMHEAPDAMLQALRQSLA
jgi:pimeloyl-ACP methyl ester carboxylesterase